MTDIASSPPSVHADLAPLGQLAQPFVDEVSVQSETDRYIVWPGQALAYKIGQLKILELRGRAEKELGEKFDIRKFHDEVLGAGALPLDVLEKRIDGWIAAEKKQPR